jgi:hypothetical protein
VDSPWATFAFAMSRLRPGDTLILKDGTYYQSLTINISGTEENPITIKAQNDGKAIVDGEKARVPLHAHGQHLYPSSNYHDIAIEGIKFQNSNWHVVLLLNVERVTLRRVSAYNAAPGNNAVFSLSWARHVLLEDCVASGTGRQMYNVNGFDHVTMRRCYGRYVSHSEYPTGSDGFAQFYGVSDCLMENCVATMVPGAPRNPKGPGLWANVGDVTANRNRFLGNITDSVAWHAFFVSSARHPIEGNLFIDNVSLNTPDGLWIKGDDNLQVRRMTIVNATGRSIFLEASGRADKMPDYVVHADIRNFYISSEDPSITTLANRYNNLYNLSVPYGNLTSKGTGEISVDPGFKVSKYGKGGYLFVPDGSPMKTAGEGGTQMGAEVLFQYKDGVLTNERLWPWPMEERVLNELGVSVTWEAQGGLWKTLDGVYEDPPDRSPAAPTGLRIPGVK